MRPLSGWAGAAVPAQPDIVKPFETKAIASARRPACPEATGLVRRGAGVLRDWARGWSRSRVFLAATLRSVDAKSRGGMARELAGRTDGPVDELAGAIGAKAAERSRAVHTKRALEGTDPRVRRVRRQIPIAALTAGSDLEHPRLLPQQRGAHRFAGGRFRSFRKPFLLGKL
jgi:hypothetical protein